MGNYRLVVLTNPLSGREDEYNDWYSNRHLDDVIAIPGIVAAQRFKIHAKVSGPASGAGHNYLAIYDIESDDLNAVLNELQTRPGTPLMPMSDAMDGAGALANVYEVITPKKQK